MRALVLLSIRLYQRTIGHQLPPACRFQPSCSQYAYDAVARHGVVRGAYLAMRRLGRCHPLNLGGYDPVP